jgi:hypothetical protein
LIKVRPEVGVYFDHIDVVSLFSSYIRPYTHLQGTHDSFCRLSLSLYFVCVGTTIAVYGHCTVLDAL